MDIGKNSSAQKVFKTIKGSKKVICCIDSRLDSDAISSALVMRSIIKRLFKKDLKLTFPDKLSQNIRKIYKDIADLTSIQTDVDPGSVDFSPYDLQLILDCGEAKHLSKYENFAIPKNLTSINIDHHNDSNKLFADINYVYRAPSACSLIYTILKKNKIKITQNEGDLLLLGILEDSGIFQFDKIEYQDLQMAAELLKLTKRNLFYYTHKLTYNEPPEEIMVKKMLLHNYKLDLENKVAYSYGLLDDYRKYNIPDGYKISYSPADYIRRTDGINFAFYVKEQKKGSYSVSLRSRLPDYDVSQIAAQFNGGGHIMSSGLRIDNAKSVDEVIRAIINASVVYNKQYFSKKEVK